jgi:hypothetical protein
MSETKTAGKRSATKDTKVKTGKTAAKSTLTSQRVAAVEKNLGESQSLRDFLSGVGWR